MLSGMGFGVNVSCLGSRLGMSVIFVLSGIGWWIFVGVLLMSICCVLI